jgi:hypothetical protein
MLYERCAIPDDQPSKQAGTPALLRRYLRPYCAATSGPTAPLLRRLLQRLVGQPVNSPGQSIERGEGGSQRAPLLSGQG